MLVLSLSVAGADPKTEVSEAIKKLGEQSGYSWTHTPKTEGSQSARRQGPIEGKTEKGGFTYLKGSLGDISYEVASKGEKMVINYNGDWLSTAEIGENQRAIQRLKALKKPVEEASQASKAAELKKESDGVYSGDLSADAAKALFALLGRRAAEAPEAKGSVKFWVKEGLLTKYEISVRGKITVGEDKREVDISQTTTVEIKDAGSTKVSLPEEAKKKLSLCVIMHESQLSRMAATSLAPWSTWTISMPWSSFRRRMSGAHAPMARACVIFSKSRLHSRFLHGRLTLLVRGVA